MKQPFLFKILSNLIALLIPILSMMSCVSTENLDLSYGVNPTRTGFIPARIALIPCLVWPPEATRIKDLPLTNRPSEELAGICNEFDKYIADGFENQPFMKGLSPKLVDKLYTASGMTPSIPAAIANEWRGLAADCQDCSSATALYSRSIHPRASWQVWLSNFSKATKGSDALMIPLLLSTNTRVRDNRGVIESIRSGAVAIFLVDTNDGSVIWSGGREADVIYRVMANTTSKTETKDPPLADLKRRLFLDTLWLEFPGRQVFR